VSLSLKRFAPKGVAQLAVLEEEALLLVLSDGTLSAYTLPSLEPATAAGAAGLSRARGVTCVPAAHAPSRRTLGEKRGGIIWLVFCCIAAIAVIAVRFFVLE
jgi:hypothetical protein